jgi:hypothetical protein
MILLAIDGRPGRYTVGLTSSGTRPMSLAGRFLAFFVLAFCAPCALAYNGPGSGVSFLAALWSVLAGFFVVLSAILFWPVRALLRRRRNVATPRVPRPPADRAPKRMDRPLHWRSRAHGGKSTRARRRHRVAPIIA